MPLTVVIGPTFQAGEFLSDVIDCSAGPIVRITVPMNWPGSYLTFDVSSDGAFYNPLYNALGEEVRIPAKAGTGILIQQQWSMQAGYIKFRAGPHATPEPVPELCEFAVALLTEPVPAP